MAASASALKKECQVSFVIPDHDARASDSYRRVALAIAGQYGKGSFCALQVTNPSKYVVTFNAAALARRSIDDGLLYESVKINMVSASQVFVTLYLKYCPYEVEDNVVSSTLQQFGEVKWSQFVMIDDEAGSYTNGDRKIGFIMKRPVPNFLRIGSATVMVTYRGVQRVCRKCRLPNHEAKDCPVIFSCRACGEQGHRAAQCPNKEKNEDGTVKNSYSDVLRGNMNWAEEMEMEDAEESETITDEPISRKNWQLPPEEPKSKVAANGEKSDSILRQDLELTDVSDEEEKGEAPRGKEEVKAVQEKCDFVVPTSAPQPGKSKRAAAPSNTAILKKKIRNTKRAERRSRSASTGEEDNGDRRSTPKKSVATSESDGREDFLSATSGESVLDSEAGTERF